MLKIRLQRVGRKNDPSFRVVVTEARKDSQSGKFIEILGSYDARSTLAGKPRPVSLKADRIKHWISLGAQTSDTVHNLLVTHKVIDAKKINVLPSRPPAKVEEAKAVEAPAEVSVKAPVETQAEVATEPTVV